MLAERIKVKELQNAQQCVEAIFDIENEPNNYLTGLKGWCDGTQTVLREAAKKKIAAIERLLAKYDAEGEFAEDGV